MNKIYVKIGNSTNKLLYGDKVEIINDFNALGQYNFDKIVYYSTNPTQERNFLKKWSNYVKKFQRKDITLIKNDYENIDEVGLDRLLGCSYFYRKYGDDFIYIDLGTAITINFVRNGIFEGGYIILGERVYFNAISQIGSLPLIKSHLIKENIGKSTLENINNGFYLLYSSFFDKIKKEYNMNIYVSGGNLGLLPMVQAVEYVNDCDLKEMKNYEKN